MRHLWLLIILWLAGAQASAHTYFVGLTDIQLSQEKSRLEIVHLYTTHDVEHVLMEQHQLKLTAEHPKFEYYLRTLIERDFTLKLMQKNLTLDWVGFEFDYDKIVIYQEVKLKKSEALPGATLTVVHQVMSEFFPEQVNTVNYQLGNNKGTLTFDPLRHTANIRFDNF